MRKLSRRSILRAVAAVSAAVMLTACGASTAVSSSAASEKAVSEVDPLERYKEWLKLLGDVWQDR